MAAPSVESATAPNGGDISKATAARVASVGVLAARVAEACRAATGHVTAAVT